VAAGQQFFLSKHVTNEVLFVAQNADNLSRLFRLQPDVKFEKAATQLQIHAFDLRRLIDTILNLQRLQERFGLNPDELVEVIGRNLERNCTPEDRDNAIKHWQAARPVIVEALTGFSKHPLAIAAKGEQLAYVREKLFTQARIVTEIRPVFDEAGKEILRAVVSHELVIDYYQGQEGKRIQIGLDAADVIQLRRACERAERKAAAIKLSLGELPWETAVLAEPSDDPRPLEKEG
jgi:hypothetical protein